MYSFVASCNVTTFTKVDKVEQGVNLFLASKLHTSFFKNEEN